MATAKAHGYELNYELAFLHVKWTPNMAFWLLNLKI
jgi:hypothetical protein